MKKVKKYQIALSVFFLLFAALLYWLHTSYFSPFIYDGNKNITYENAEVIKIDDEYLEKDKQTGSGYRGTQELTLKITSGSHKGEVVNASNYLTKTHNILAKEGSKLVICIDEMNVSMHVSVYNYARSNSIYFMIAVFLAAMVLVGERKGLKSAIGLIFTISCILFFTLPFIFHGASPILISIISCILIASVSLTLLEGLSKKVLVAILGTAFGVVMAGVIFYIFSLLMHVSGFNLEESETLIVVAQKTGLQIKQVLFASVLIASLGAVLDVSMSVASSLHELYVHKPDIEFKELYKAGINIGKDMIGTMSTTLILAFVGSSFATMLVFMAYAVNYNQLINMDYVALELAQALAGSIGIIVTVPFTAYLSSFIFLNKQEK